MNNILFLTGIKKIIKSFDNYLIDLWGVIHNGVECNHDAIKVLENLKKNKKKVILISNAPRPHYVVQKFLKKINLRTSLYDYLVTSGDVTKNYIKSKYHNKNFYHLGPRKDEDLYANLKIKKTSINKSDFVLCTGLTDQKKINNYFLLLKKIKQRRLNLLCANPDIIVHKGDRSEYCAGFLAKKFENFGGNSKYFGKPYKNLYKYCFQKFLENFKKKINLKKTLVIGDNLNTDILGANNINVKSLFILGGIHKDQFYSENIVSELKKINKKIKINFFQKQLIW